MVNRINDIIFDNLREGSLFDFEPTKIELIVDNWGAGIKTINKGEKGLIDVSLYDVYSNRDMDRIEDKNSVEVYRNSIEHISSWNSRYDEYKERLMEKRIW